MFARLNLLKTAGGHGNGKPMGWLNPWIYANGGKMFHDVTQGKNTGGFGDDGFTAIEGWDAATGFGTPNWPEMVKAL